jgi:hypothetical protein
MQIISGIVGVINTTVTTTITLDQVAPLLESCQDKAEFKRRAFHIVKREAGKGKDGYVAYPVDFKGFDEVWDQHHSPADEAPVWHSCDLT